MKINKLDFIIYALLIALFKIFVIPTVLQQVIKIVSIAIILIYLVNRIHRKELFNISFWWALIIIGTSFLGYLKNSITLDNSIDSILHGMCIYSLYTLIAYCSRTDNLKRFINILFSVLAIYCVISLITIVAFGGAPGTGILYFAGNKFRTSYYFIFFLTMIQIKYYDEISSKIRSKILFLILSFVVIGITKYIQCSTAMVATVCVALSIFIPRKMQNILKNPTTVIISLGISALLLLLTNIISENYYVNYVVTELLGEDIGLTGRYRIYGYLFGIIRNSWLFGYGYGNYAVGTIVGYGNAQNSVIQLIIDYGIVGLVGFSILMIHSFRKGSKTENKWGYYVYIYVMLICAMIEICFNYNFYTMLFLICFDREASYYKTLTKYKIKS